MLTLPEKDGGQHTSILYFKVDDIETVHKTLVERGVGFDGAPHLIAKLPAHDLWMAFFRDPDNNVMALMAEKTTAS